MSTERRELVHQLQVTLSKMEVVLGAIADAVVFLDEDSQVQWCNTAFEQLVKRSHSTLVGSQFRKLLPLIQAGQPVTPECYPDVKMRESGYEATEYEVVQGDRSLVLHISGNCVQQDDRSTVLVIRDITQTQPKEAEPRTAEQERGKQVEEKLRLTRDEHCIEGVITDISDRKRAEIALAESEFKFRTIVENANDVLGILDLEGIIRYISPNVVNLIGFTPAELEGQAFDPFVYPDDLPKLREVYHRLATTGERISGIEYRSKHKDGRCIWQLSNLSSFQDINGELLIIGVVRDITERKQAEEALKASEARLNAILSNLVACIQRSRIYANRDWNYEYVSAGSLQLWGYSPEELIADKNLILSRHVPEDLENIYQNVFDRIFVEGTYEGEYRYHHPDGRLRWISFDMNSVRDEATDCWICTGISTDITARKLAEVAAAERARLAAFRADVGSALGMSDTLPAILNCCTQAAVKHLNATFARIWTFNPKDDVFELKASAGLYTRLNGTYSRVPITKFLIDRKPQPYITNNLPNDPYVVDKDWVKREGLLALACYPIMLEQELLGTIVIFARQKLSESTLEALQFAAREIALGIKRKQAEAALEYRARVESLLSSISRHFIDQDVDTAINFTLEAIANFIGCDRSYIFEYSDDQRQYCLVHEWYAADIPPLSDEARGGILTLFPWFYNKILTRQVIDIPSIAELPPEAAAERDVFQSQSVQSTLVAPMTHSGKVVGCLSVDVVRLKKTWTQDDINVLKLVGELIAIGCAR
ncbi:PAS domain S-box protein, partial [Allocoleopsis sp.]|uniref:PAS domain S-box protein n=1 Tax=Allocoleopsis sp. TaxID=3088169 RepID=UPI002FD657DB